jgi:hypothetical protein
MWWVRFLNFARNETETNVEIYRENGVFYCQVVRDVAKGQELLVWFEEKLCNELGLTKEEKPEEGQFFNSSVFRLLLLKLLPKTVCSQQLYCVNPAHNSLTLS